MIYFEISRDEICYLIDVSPHFCKMLIENLLTSPMENQKKVLNIFINLFRIPKFCLAKRGECINLGLVTKLEFLKKTLSGELSHEINTLKSLL